jgi:hypothetical protein
MKHIAYRNGVMISGHWLFYYVNGFFIKSATNYTLVLILDMTSACSFKIRCVLMTNVKSVSLYVLLIYSCLVAPTLELHNQFSLSVSLLLVTYRFSSCFSFYCVLFVDRYNSLLYAGRSTSSCIHCVTTLWVFPLLP